jgi:O-antigen/teichoic acid export membrane protein
MELIDKTYWRLYLYRGAVITLVLNYLLIPSMSYYGSAIATIAAYGMMVISYFLGNKYYPIPYDMKKNRLSVIVGFFSRQYLFMDPEKIICWRWFINRVSCILSIITKYS